MTKKIFLFFFLISSNIHFGQISDVSYSVMLKNLLSHSVPEVTADLISKDAIILDTREKKEYAISHLPNAIWVGYSDFDAQRVSKLNKNKPVVVYCSVGYRSEKIGEKLIKMGFNDVKNLRGGIFEWVNTDHKVVGAHNKVTDYVHTYDKVWGVWLKKGKKIVN